MDKRSSDECWPWLGALKAKGYGSFCIGKNKVLEAHRASYLINYGYLPEGLVIDHLCRNRACVNPFHLEAVTAGENCLRGESPWAKAKRKTHCIHGHAFDLKNTYIAPNGTRKCRECRRRASAKQYAKRRMDCA